MTRTCDRHLAVGFALLLGLFLAILPVRAARPLSPDDIRPGRLIELRAGNRDTRSHIPRPQPRWGRSVTTAPTALATSPATITVTYNGFSPEAQAAFQAAVDIWETQITSPVPIQVVANWTPLGAGVLGSAGAHRLLRNFTNAPVANTWYPIALANKLAGYDLLTGGDGQDIDANFNSSFSSWYFGADGNTPSGKYDFVTVVLHELGHGLGFLGSGSVSSGSGSWGLGSPAYPVIYDRYVVNGANQQIINTSLFPNPSTALAQQLTGNALYFNGTQAVAANGGVKPRLYAPATFQAGSSYSHLDEMTYGVGSLNSLMTPVLNSAEAIHDPGPITRGIFTDIGWDIAVPTQPGMPDLSIRRRGDATYTGDNIYNNIASQTVGQSTGQGSPAVYEIRVQNDAATSATVMITGTAGDDAWTVRYYDALTGGNEISGLVTAAGWTTPTLATGAYREIRAEVTPNSTASVGAMKDVYITGTGAGTTAPTDAVRATTTVAASPLSAVTLTADHASPQPVNTSITLTAAAVGGINVEYRFRVGYVENNLWSWTTLRGYATSPSVIWTPAEAHIYSVQVWAREVGSTALYQVTQTIRFTISSTTGNTAPLTGVNLTAMPTSPQRVGTPITLTATPVGGTTVEYLFRVGYVENNLWHWSVLRGYSTSPTAVWTPTVARRYTLVVMAREVGSTQAYQVSKAIGYSVSP